LHEDWGTTPAAIDNLLTVADRVTWCGDHTDTLTIRFRRDHAAAFRAGIATFHTEARAAAMRPTSSACAGEERQPASSTNPTMALHGETR